MVALDRARTAQALYDACMAELEAPKPGNVHKFNPGHAMDWQDFERSARAIAPLLTDLSLPFGDRVLQAVQATFAVAQCNTNLGIILLSAPLIQAALGSYRGSFKSRVNQVLEGFDSHDATQVFKAIALASPGGLGEHPTHDVRRPPDITLQQAMDIAAPHDLVARQYANGYADILGFGLRRNRWADRRWPGHPFATALSVYLGFLGRLPDSHIVRKFGPEPLVTVMAQARQLDQALRQAQTPDDLLPRLLKIDQDFKTQKINPGTSADLTVGCLLAGKLMAMMRPGKSGHSIEYAD